MAATGTCYKDVFNAILHGAPNLPELDKFEKVRVVHGTVRGKTKARIKHAWIEFQAGNYAFAWEPENQKVYAKNDFYMLHAAWEDYEMTPQRYTKLALKFKHSGDFTKKELGAVKE
jgi:hypothetical protein